MNKYYIAILIVLLTFSGCSSIPGENKLSKVYLDNYSGYDIALTGDIMICRRMQKMVDSKGYKYPFSKTAEILKKHTLVFGNLEAPLIYKDKEKELEQNGEKQIYLYSDEQVGKALKESGVNFVSLANNHTLDYGEDGLLQTMEILDKNEIEYHGVRIGNLGNVNKPHIKEINGAKVGIFCYSQVSHKMFAASKSSYGTIPATLAVIQKDINFYRNDIDVIIVYMHWGKEKQDVKKYQYKMGREIIDAGADFVFGSHTHMFQDIEKYNDKYIFYGLGNYIFDQNNEPNKYSAIVSLSIKDKSIDKVKITPVYSIGYVPGKIEEKTILFDFLSGIRLHNVKMEELF